MSTTTDAPTDALEMLRNAEADYEMARRVRIDVIELARLDNLSWEKIGAALGMSHVAARRLYLRNGGEA